MSLAPPDPDAARAWLREASRPHRRRLALVAAVAVADVLPAIALAAGLALGVSALAGGDAAGVALGAALALAGFLGRGLLQPVALGLGAQAAAGAKNHLRTGLISALVSSGQAGAANVTQAIEGVEALDGYWSRYAAARAAASASPLIVIATVALASPVAAGILAATLIPFVAGMALAGTAAAAESRRQFEAMERLSGLFLDRIRALPAILSFQAEERTVHEVATASHELAVRTQKVLRIAFLSSGVLEFFSALSVALVAVYCGFNLLRLLPFPAPEQLDLARAFFALALAPEVYAPIRRLAAAYHDRQAAEAAAPSLGAGREEAVDRPRAAALRYPPSIAFAQARVVYGGRPVLDGFDLTLRPGETVALVGASGSGKTTILKLLLGLAPLTGGRIDIDGCDLVRFGDLSASIGWAGQDPVVMAGTLAENIDLGRTGASRDAIAAAAATAGLALDLDRRLDERGGGLSGGERRRLGLARALLKDAPIFLLDEPTANLDAESEAALLPALRRACQGRTCLIATHSAALAAIADRQVRL
ncbi:thiol reductant ABC exporter subunit CydD [Brevundimonas sp.]|uniref:thiol reductant ABC exporter subunit CydD n=1 Tax=Brevundimonas sp. TaxID=1871086 RepID=UPI0025FF6818|nr:thiol reductant ABC exporter subunit CydD [Brevundimonas sp.]